MPQCDIIILTVVLVLFKSTTDFKRMAIETVIIPQKIGLRLTCPKVTCKHTWIYLGKSEIYASCPVYKSTVTIQPKPKKNKNVECKEHYRAC